MIKLAPSVLSADFTILGKQLAMIEQAGAHYVHIDVMDGHFVPNISLGIPVIKSMRGASKLTFDVHLMIENPERYIDAFAEAGADILTVHAEACKNIEQVLEKIKAHGIKTGVSIKPGTSAESIFPVLAQTDLVLVMSVEPGFGGQALIPETLKKAEVLAKQIKSEQLGTELEMDGGIYLNNVTDVLRSGVNVVVAGSAVFSAPDISNAVQSFYRIFDDFEGQA